MIAGSAAKDADTVRQYIGAYEAAGCDELIFFPGVSRRGAGRPAGRGRALAEAGRGRGSCRAGS